MYTRNPESNGRRRKSILGNQSKRAILGLPSSCAEGHHLEILTTMAPGVTWSSGGSGLVAWGWQRLPWGVKIPFSFSQWAEWRLVLCEPAGPAGLGSRVCSLHSCTGPPSEGPTLDLMLCSYRLEFLHAFWTGNPTLSFCSGPCKLYSHSRSHDMKMARKQWTTLWSKCTVIDPYKRGNWIMQPAQCLHNKTDPELKSLLFFLQSYDCYGCHRPKLNIIFFF